MYLSGRFWTGTLSAIRTITQKQHPADQGDVPNRESSQKEFQKVGIFLGGKKVSFEHRDLPCNPPQLHHDLPSQNTAKTQKPLQKPLSTTKTNFF
jgi:hypothetical protein